MRRRARECALQILYQLDVGGHLRSGDTLRPELDRYWGSFEPVSPEVRAFTERLVEGVAREVVELDRILEEAANHWKLGRMAKVDRNLLRLAAFEILHCPDIPRSSSINEAIEIGKRFSTEDSGSFLNGVLDRLGEKSS